MLKRISIVTALAAALAAPVSAQDALPQTRPAPAAQQPATPAPEPAVVKPERTPSTGANVRLELNIADQRGGGTPANKTVTMVVADGGHGRIRSTADVPTNNMGMSRSIFLNADATPTIVRDGKLRLILTIEYRPNVETTAADGALANVSESLTVF